MAVAGSAPAAWTTALTVRTVPRTNAEMEDWERTQSLVGSKAYFGFAGGGLRAGAGFAGGGGGAAWVATDAGAVAEGCALAVAGT